jgi:exo-beta-1,3-glucanase (GH17 family)
MKHSLTKALLLGVLFLGFAGWAQAAHPRKTDPDLTVQKWYGNAIDYSGYRAGQSPQLKIFPSHAQILEDLTILKKNWKLILLYGGDQHSRDVLEVIQQNKLGIKVVLGLWLDGRPGFEGENAEQVATAIRLANQYRKIVIAVNVGNEILVTWSDHKLTEDKAIEYVEQVRKAVRCPVTVADDFLYWRQPEAKLADHVDFILMHAYPMWGHEDIDTAMPSTIKDYESVRKAHPGKTIVIGEAGWASYSVGPQHVPKAGDEVKQKRYYEELNAWAKANNVTTFYFEAFDEPWKGTGTEGHWGLFSVDRKAKLAMQGLYPELMPAGPTSPSYDLPPAPGVK